MGTIQDRLKEICSKYFKGQISLMASYYGIPQPTLYHSINDNASVSYNLLHSIAASKEFYVNSGWLLTGEGEMIQKGEKSVMYEDRYLEIIRNLVAESKEKQKVINSLLGVK